MSRVSSMTFHTRLKKLKAWVQLPILDSKYSKLEYNLPYSTQHTHRLSTTFHTLLEYEYGIGQILNDESSIEYDFPYSTRNTQSLSMTFHTRLKVLNTQYSTQVWVHVFVFVTSFCGAFCTHTYTCLADRHSARCHYSTHYYRYSLLSLPTGGLLIWAHKVVSPPGHLHLHLHLPPQPLRPLVVLLMSQQQHKRRSTKPQKHQKPPLPRASSSPRRFTTRRRGTCTTCRLTRLPPSTGRGALRLSRGRLPRAIVFVLSWELHRWRLTTDQGCSVQPFTAMTNGEGGWKCRGWIEVGWYVV